MPEPEQPPPAASANRRDWEMQQRPAGPVALLLLSIGIAGMTIDEDGHVWGLFGSISIFDAPLHLYRTTYPRPRAMHASGHSVTGGRTSPRMTELTGPSRVHFGLESRLQLLPPRACDTCSPMRQVVTGGSIASRQPTSTILQDAFHVVATVTTMDTYGVVQG